MASSVTEPTTFPSNKPTATTTQPTARPTFVIGDLSVTLPELGIKICTGMTARVIAKANQYILFNGTTTTTNSDIKFHSMADAADIFSTDDDGGYVYVSNSEMSNGNGGVYGIYFNKHGQIINYKRLLHGTSRNCGSGRTPWNTFISCEEYANGQCWQVDPLDIVPPEITRLGGSGGNYESVAVDNRDSSRPVFYVTEDHEYGALRRYVPPPSSTVNNWAALTMGGTRDYLIFLNSTHFGWTLDKPAAQTSSATYYPNTEGIDCINGMLYFVSKVKYKVFVLAIDSGTYTSFITNGGTIPGGGSFASQPDQLYHNGEYTYFTEDGGRTPGVYAIHKSSGIKHAIFEASFEVYSNDETTGLAFSPDNTRMYVALQDCKATSLVLPLGIGQLCTSSIDCGCLFELRRTDGQTFDGQMMSLKFHHSQQLDTATTTQGASTPTTLFH